MVTWSNRPADEATRSNLGKIKLDGINVESTRSWKPRILIYDVERDIPDSELSGIIAKQYPELGINESDAPRVLKLLFRKGPKSGDNVWWVMEVDPTIFKNCMELKRLYISYMSCKIREFNEITQCNKCQKFGHSEKYCRADSPICGWCAISGHGKKDCPNNNKEPKCINCAKSFTSGHKLCEVKERALRFKERHTDYCGPAKAVGTHNQDVRQN